jgi:hypothetical protein
MEARSRSGVPPGEVPFDAGEEPARPPPGGIEAKVRKRTHASPSAKRRPPPGGVRIVVAKPLAQAHALRTRQVTGENDVGARGKGGAGARERIAVGGEPFHGDVVAHDRSPESQPFAEHRPVPDRGERSREGVDGGHANVRRHDRGRTFGEEPTVGDEIAFHEVRKPTGIDRFRRVGVGGDPAVAGEMLEDGREAARPQPLGGGAGEEGDRLGSGGEGSSGKDETPGGGEIDDGGEDEIDPKGGEFHGREPTRDAGGTAGEGGIVRGHGAEDGGRRKRAESRAQALDAPSLLIDGDEKRPRKSAEPGEKPTESLGAAVVTVEEDDAAHRRCAEEFALLGTEILAVEAEDERAREFSTAHPRSTVGRDGGRGKRCSSVPRR